LEIDCHSPRVHRQRKFVEASTGASLEPSTVLTGRRTVDGSPMGSQPRSIPRPSNFGIAVAEKRMRSPSRSCTTSSRRSIPKGDISISSGSGN
jgi:hypothetical protein